MYLLDILVKFLLSKLTSNEIKLINFYVNIIKQRKNR